MAIITLLDVACQFRFSHDQTVGHGLLTAKTAFDLLHAVDALDELRGILADREEPGFFGPPEIREELMQLHGLVFNGGYQVSRENLCKAWLTMENINDQLYEIIRHSTNIEKTLADLRHAMPEFTDEEINRACNQA